MRKLKVLNKDMTSPFQDFKYEMHKKYTCDNFNDNPSIDCAPGFYATDIEGLPYCFNIDRRIFEVEVGGKQVIYDQYKQRFEYQTVVRECSFDEVKELAIKEERRLGYKLSEVLFPVNPLLIQRGNGVTDYEVDLFKKWASVSDSVYSSIVDAVYSSVRGSVYSSIVDAVYSSIVDEVYFSVSDSVYSSIVDAVYSSVRDSVAYSVGYSVRVSAMAYVSSLFQSIEHCVNIDHQQGESLFQAGVDLWVAGLVPIFDGKTWRLYAGEKATVVFELEI